jgi:hypothetical protein
MRVNLKQNFEPTLSRSHPPSMHEKFVDLESENRERVLTGRQDLGKWSNTLIGSLWMEAEFHHHPLNPLKDPTQAAN